jgi:hypothetical protein
VHANRGPFGQLLRPELSRNIRGERPGRAATLAELQAWKGAMLLRDRNCGATKAFRAAPLAVGPTNLT